MKKNLLRPEQQAKLAQLAKQERVSAAEIYRRAIDAYQIDNSNKTGDKELEQLAEMILHSNKITTEALAKAHQAVQETLAYFRIKRTHNDHQQQNF